MKTFLFLLMVMTLAIACNHDEEVTPTPVPLGLTANETLLLGTWILDKTENYNYSGQLTTINYTNGTLEGYQNGVLISTTNNTAYYYHITFLSTPFVAQTVPASDGYYKSNVDANGSILESMWKVLPNFGGAGKDKIDILNVFIYTLSGTELITRTKVNTTYADTQIKYYHKQ